MSMKIYELAKELGMASKELLLKANSMGVEAKSHMSAISDIDAVAVKNAVTRGRSGTETKIIKVAPRKNKKETDEDEPRVVVKAAVMRAASTGVRQKSDYGAKSPAKENLQTPKPLQGAVRRAVDGIPVDVVRIPAAARQPDEKEQELESAGRQPALKEAQPEQKTEVPVKTDKPENPDKIGKKAEIAMIPQSRRVERAEIEKEELESREEIARQAETAAGESAEKNEEALSKEGRGREKEQRQPVSREHADRKSQENRSRRPAGTGEGYERKPSRPAAAGVSRDERPSGSANTAGRARKPAVSARTPVNRAVRPAAGKVERKQPERAGTRRKDKDTSPSVKRVYHNVSLEKRSSKPKSRPRPQQKIESAETELMQDLAPGTMVINVPITVAGFAEQVERTTSEIIMKLMRLGVMANINQNIDEDTAMVLAEELDVPIVIGKNLGDLQEEGIESFEDKEEDLKSRPPVITVMGHVDHGKTSLLDAIRKTNVTMGEAGGITQHIGASEVTVNGERIVFLDTPGHEAFTAMRARGAHVTDIAVLVVAADDGVKPQTVESISHAKAAGVPVIVAINKIDKPGANPDRVRQELADQGILVEGWGGTTICVLVSAKSGEGIVSLLEMILLQAEILELRANPGRLGVGTVIEARLDRTKGPVATLLVLNGTLESGMYIVAGTTSGRVRAMTDGQGNLIRKAGPAAAVEILGLTEAPQAGDEFNALRDGVAAREIALNRKAKLREEVMARNSSTTLEKLFSQIQEGETRELNLIIKGDVQGSVGALDASLEKLRNENVRVKIVHTGVGTVTESDIMLASAAGAIIIAFNVRPGSAVSNMAKLENVEIRTYRVIYDVISDVEAAMKGMLDPVFHEVVLGEAEVRNIFRIPGAGVVAGAYVTEGKMLRNADIRLVRDGAVVLEGKIASLRRFKDDVREVVHSYECGIGIENYNDIKEGDVIEAFTMEETKRE